VAARLRDELPAPEHADASGVRALTACIDHGPAGDDVGPNGDVQGPAIVHGGHRPVGLAHDRPADIATARPPRPQGQRRTVVTLDDIRLGDPPPDAALVVALPAFAPHSAIDQAADLGLTADWPILGVIGIRRGSWLASLMARVAGRPAGSPGARMPDARDLDAEKPKTLPGMGTPSDIHREREDD
jgi:hypothetical protein